MCQADALAMQPALGPGSSVRLAPEGLPRDNSAGIYSAQRVGVKRFPTLVTLMIFNYYWCFGGGVGASAPARQRRGGFMGPVRGERHAPHIWNPRHKDTKQPEGTTYTTLKQPQ